MLQASGSCHAVILCGPPCLLFWWEEVYIGIKEVDSDLAKGIYRVETICVHAYSYFVYSNYQSPTVTEVLEEQNNEVDEVC